MILASVLLTVMSAVPPLAAAHETDQFTVPDVPLADIGPEVTAEIVRRLSSIMDDMNRQMASHPSRWSPAQAERELAQRLYHDFGLNPFQTDFEKWFLRHDFKAKPALFHVDYEDSVFKGTAARRPLLALSLCPTVHLYGVDMGLDKIGHFVQQGHQYYVRYMNAIGKPGATRSDALAAAIRHGITLENGIYGAATIGVYSNADMAANYAGMHFYLNLTQPVSLGGQIYPPIVELHQGQWRYTLGQPPADMLARFITEHLNEARNPPYLTPDIRPTYERNVRQLAPRWLSHHRTTATQEQRLAVTLTRWFGEPYGYARPTEVVTIHHVYFESLSDNAPPPADATQAGLHSPGM